MFTLQEFQLMRQSLDVITILGKDATVVSDLQKKLDEIIINIQNPPKESRK